MSRFNTSHHVDNPPLSSIINGRSEVPEHKYGGLALFGSKWGILNDMQVKIIMSNADLSFSLVSVRRSSNSGPVF
jgi:hypothetical protein